MEKEKVNFLPINFGGTEFQRINFKLMLCVKNLYIKAEFHSSEGQEWEFQKAAEIQMSSLFPVCHVQSRMPCQSGTECSPSAIGWTLTRTVFLDLCFSKVLRHPDSSFVYKQ